MKRKILAVLISILMVPFWGMLLLNAAVVSIYTIFVGLIATFVLSIWLSGFYNQTNERILLFLGPVFYVVSGLIIQPWRNELLSMPIFAAFALFTLPFITPSISKNYLFLAFVSISCFIYTLSFSMPGKELLEAGEMNFALETASNQTEEINKQLDLRSFKFINHESDTVSIVNGTKYVLIETWNEQCKPCIESIKGLSEYFSEQPAINQFYLYGEMRGKSMSKEEVFKFDLIPTKQKILMDNGNEFFTKSNTKKFPAFLLFNPEGKLIWSYYGYSQKLKSKIISSIEIHTTPADNVALE
jgi:thioredoxin-related protein